MTVILSIRCLHEQFYFLLMSSPAWSPWCAGAVVGQSPPPTQLSFLSRGWARKRAAPAAMASMPPRPPSVHRPASSSAGVCGWEGDMRWAAAVVLRRAAAAASHGWGSGRQPAAAGVLRAAHCYPPWRCGVRGHCPVPHSPPRTARRPARRPPQRVVGTLLQSSCASCC